MTDEHSHIHVQIPSNVYSEILELLESRIRSERARANAFKSRSDFANASDALGRKQRLEEIRHQLMIGYQHEDQTGA